MEELKKELEELKSDIRTTKIIAFILVAIFIGVYFIDFFTRPNLVSFDFKGTTNTFLGQIAKLPLDEKEKELMTKRYQKAVSEIISDYDSKNTIVLVKGAFVSDVEDKTAEIKMQIAQKMKNMGQ